MLITDWIAYSNGGRPVTLRLSAELCPRHKLFPNEQILCSFVISEEGAKFKWDAVEYLWMSRGWFLRSEMDGVWQHWACGMAGPWCILFSKGLGYCQDKKNTKYILCWSRGERAMSVLVSVAIIASKTVITATWQHSAFCTVIFSAYSNRLKSMIKAHV